MTQRTADTAAIDTTERRGELFISRRSIIVGAATVATAGVFGVSMVSRPAVAIGHLELTADGDDLTSHDGSIDAILVEPSIELEWEGFNDPAEEIDIEIEFSTDGEADLVLYDEQETLSGTNGSETFNYSEKDLLAEGWSDSTFAAPEDDATNESEITAIVTVDAPDASDSATADFTVTVHNHPAAVNVGGHISTDAQSDEEVET